MSEFVPDFAARRAVHNLEFKCGRPLIRSAEEGGDDGRRDAAEDDESKEAANSLCCQVLRLGDRATHLAEIHMESSELLWRQTYGDLAELKGQVGVTFRRPNLKEVEFGAELNESGRVRVTGRVGWDLELITLVTSSKGLILFGYRRPLNGIPDEPTLESKMG